jgi:hypothetical protein
VNTYIALFSALSYRSEPSSSVSISNILNLPVANLPVQKNGKVFVRKKIFFFFKKVRFAEVSLLLH